MDDDYDDFQALAPAEPSEPGTALARTGEYAGLDVVQIAERANALHKGLEVSFVETAAEIGRLLIEAKRRSRHGEFTDFIECHCTFSTRTARVYMRVASRWAELEHLHGETLTLDGVLKFLRFIGKLRTHGDPGVVRNGVHPTNSYLVSWIPMILSLKNA